MEPLVVPKDDEQAELMFEMYHKAREMARRLKEENMRIKEIRNLTLFDLTEAASCLAKGEPVSKDIWRKFEKDYRLYGITERRAGADGEMIPGTKATSGKGRTGEDMYGCSSFTNTAVVILLSITRCLLFEIKLSTLR